MPKFARDGGKPDTAVDVKIESPVHDTERLS